MSRGVKEIISDLSLFNPRNASTRHRLAHDCYMILVGYVKSNSPQLKELEKMIESQGQDSSDGDLAAAASLYIMECEDAEFILEYVTVKHNFEELEDARKEHLVYEDNFNSASITHMEGNGSYKKLRSVCRHYEMKPEVNIDKVMGEHDAHTN